MPSVPRRFEDPPLADPPKGPATLAPSVSSYLDIAGAGTDVRLVKNPPPVRDNLFHLLRKVRPDTPVEVASEMFRGEILSDRFLIMSVKKITDTTVGHNLAGTNLKFEIGF